MEFVDRILKCVDCGQDFVFTAGEQLFFHDRQFKNDPKRCKLCKAKRAGLARPAATGGNVALPLSRTETRTTCSSCGVETTVPFKPTQGRPVLCRSCFQLKRVPAAVAAVATMDSPQQQVAAAAAALDQALAAAPTDAALTDVALTDAAIPAVPAPSATVEMIAEAPAAVTAAETVDAALVAAAAEAPQA